MGVNKEDNVHGTVPDYGAIFMTNSVTITECFKRRLFGLPSWLGNFVGQIKAGMILFLFEYEKRLLHGVFQATSNGAMNIEPHAYSSSGKQFPAQVKFSIIWCCKPLSENQFRNAIKENYFSAKKFNFGLSEEQVRKLLSLFSLTKLNDQLHRRRLSSDSFEGSSDYLIDESRNFAADDRLIMNGRLQGRQMDCEDQVNTMQESVSLPHYNLRNITPSTENPIHYSHMDNRNLTYNSGCQNNAQIMMPSHHSQSECMNSMPFQTSIYLENNTNPSVTQCQINVSCSDPNLRSLPTREFENDGSLRSILANPYPSHELNYSPFPDQNDQNIAGQVNTEAYYTYVPVTKEFPIHLPFDSVKVSSLPSNKHSTANHGHECYINTGTMHYDRERRGSVFSRLAYPTDASIQEFYDYSDHEKLIFDSSIDETMTVSQKHHGQWEKIDHEVLNQEQKDGRSSVKRKQTKSSLCSYGNCFQVSDELGTKVEDSIGGDGSQIAIGTPFVNFKRRKKPCKVEDDRATGGQNLNVESVQLPSVQQKRRKLIRPCFANIESHDCGDRNSVSPNLKISSKNIQAFGERAVSDPLVKMNEAEKLGQAAKLPDIIWLVDDEDKNIGNGGAETEDCWGSTRNGSKDSHNSTHKGSTLTDEHSQNLNNSGLCCSQQESAPLEGSEPNAGNSFIRVGEDFNECNEKELVKSMKIVDEPYQGCNATEVESSAKRSVPLDSALEGSEPNVGNSFIRVGEDVNECNEKELVKSMKIVDEPYQGCNATEVESSAKRSVPLDSALEGSEPNAGNSFIRVGEDVNECNEKELVKSMKIVDEPFQGCNATEVESSAKRSVPLDSALEGSEPNAGNSFIRVGEDVNECNEKELVNSMKIVDEPYQGCNATDVEISAKRSVPLDSASESVPEEFIERSKHNNEGEQLRSETEL